MRRLLGGLAGAALVLVVAGPVRADDDDKDMRALVDKAIKAKGGADELAKYKGDTVKMKGTVHIMGMDIEFTGSMAFERPDRFRTATEAEVGGTTFKHVEVINGNKGWVAENDNTKEMSKEQLETAHEQVYHRVLTNLLALRDKDYKLSPLGEKKVNGHEAVGVRVQHKGHKDANLYFDKKSHLLVGMETRGKDLQAGGEEVAVESYYDDYKKVDGIQVAHKVTVKRDDKPFVESELTEVKLAKSLDDDLFTKP